MSRRQHVAYDTVNWGGHELVPVQYTTNALISLLRPKVAKRYHRAGTVDILSPDSWHRIQSTKGAGLSVDPAYLRT